LSEIEKAIEILKRYHDSKMLKIHCDFCVNPEKYQNNGVPTEFLHEVEGVRLAIGTVLTVLEKYRRTQPENNPTYEENENFIQNKFGYCFYTLDSSPLIYNLYVHPQYRHHGHSRTLLQLAIGEIWKSGYEGEIHMQAKPREDSIGLVDLIKYYKSMGLVIYDDHKPEQEESDG